MMTEFEIKQKREFSQGSNATLATKSQHSKRFEWLYCGAFLGLLAASVWFQYARNGEWLLLLFLFAGLSLTALHVKYQTRMLAQRERWSGRGALLLLAASVFGVCISLLFFAKEGAHNVLAWRIFMVSLLPLLWVAVMTPRQRDSTTTGVREACLIVAITTVAAAFRFYMLDVYPYGVWFDEAQNILVAQKILANPSYRPVFISDLSQLPAFLFYYYALFVWAFGANVFAIRLAVTVAGIAAIPAVWWLARELFSPRVALWAAAFLALSRWHITFSRFGVANIFVTLLMPLVISFFIRGQRRRSFSDSLLAGVLLGIGMQTYYAFVALPALLLVVFFYRWITRTPSYALGGLVVLGAAVCVYAPVGLFATMHWDTFSARMVTVASTSPSELIKVLVREPARTCEILGPLCESALKHLKMFHLQGDSNGRHNLPGVPMLDYATGALFGGGFFMMLCSAFRWPFLLLLGWFTMTISAGIFTLAFEAPQAARTLGLTSIISILAALPIASLSDPARQRVIRVIGVVVGGLALSYAAMQTFRVFFIEQRLDPSAWASFSTAQTRIGELAAEAGKRADLYAPEIWINEPTVQLLANGNRAAFPFTSAQDLPLPDRGRDAVVVSQLSDAQGQRRLSQLYPQAKVVPFSSPKRPQGAESTLFSSFHISAKSIQELHRPMRTEFARNTVVWSGAVGSFAEIPNFVQRGQNYRVSLESALQVPESGKYQLRAVTEGAIRVLVDREVVLSEGQVDVDLTLAQGMHHVLVERCVAGAESPVVLKWRQLGGDTVLELAEGQVYAPIAAPGGLTGDYRRGLARAAVPEFSRIDQTISFYFHLIPLPRPFSIDWSGSLMVPVTGEYSIGTASIDQSRLTIDGNEYPATLVGGGSSFQTLHLEAGLHSIRMAYDSVKGYGQAYLRWVRPDGVAEEIPADRLLPLPPSRRAVLKMPKDLLCR